MSFQALSNDENLEAIRSRLNPVKRGVDRMKFTALGGFIFAGGFSLGVEAAGFHVAGHLESSEIPLGVVPSRQRWPVVALPFESDEGNSWMSFAKSLTVKPDFVYANAPCVAYAGTGKREGSSDPRMCYTRQATYGLAFELQPTVWAWELVPGVFDHERGWLEAMALRAKRLGYQCTAFLTSSALHGGYQDRRRFHFVASRVRLDFEGTLDAEPMERRGVKTLGQALELVSEVRLGSQLFNDANLYRGAFSTIVPFCPPGSHLRDVPNEVMRLEYRPRGSQWTGSGLPGFAHTRGRMDRPSPNVLGGHTIFHPTEDRYLTPRECATVMGFPLDYRFSEGTKAYAEVGKGLCTHNAEFLARVVMNGLQTGKSTSPVQQPDGSWLQVIDWRNRAPKLNLRMTTKERDEWWIARHPDRAKPVEWEAA
jgi:DNA (cytosine-5)-methyltransferase 1